MLPYFGAVPEEARVVIDGNLISTAGVSAGIDGSLHLAAMLAGEAAAQRIQLEMEYAPEPPFDSGTPAHAPAPILNAARERAGRFAAARLEAVQRAANRLRRRRCRGARNFYRSIVRTTRNRARPLIIRS